MTSISRALWGIGLAILALLVLGWGAGILYWHVRVALALRSWEKGFNRIRIDRFPDYGATEEDAQVLIHAGCRALPQLVQAYEATQDRDRQRALMNRLIDTLAGPGVQSQASDHLMEERIGRWLPSPSDSPPESVRRVTDFARWWAANGARYHRWWRFWSEWCTDE